MGKIWIHTPTAFIMPLTWEEGGAFVFVAVELYDVGMERLDFFGTTVFFFVFFFGRSMMRPFSKTMSCCFGQLVLCILYESAVCVFFVAICATTAMSE